MQTASRRAPRWQRASSLAGERELPSVLAAETRGATRHKHGSLWCPPILARRERLQPSAAPGARPPAMARDGPHQGLRLAVHQAPRQLCLCLRHLPRRPRPSRPPPWARSSPPPVVPAALPRRPSSHGASFAAAPARTTGVRAGAPRQATQRPGRWQLQHGPRRMQHTQARRAERGQARARKTDTAPGRSRRTVAAPCTSRRRMTSVPRASASVTCARPPAPRRAPARAPRGAAAAPQRACA